MRDMYLCMIRLDSRTPI